MSNTVSATLCYGVFAGSSRAGALRRAAAWARTAPGGVALLIAATLMARLVFAAALGLGIDESYMVAAGWHLRLGYFDRPPIASSLARGSAYLFGGDSDFVVRLPFVLLSALTTFLMYHVTKLMFGARAGLWAAVALNMAPVFGISTGSWCCPTDH